MEKNYSGREKRRKSVRIMIEEKLESIVWYSYYLAKWTLQHWKLEEVKVKWMSKWLISCEENSQRIFVIGCLISAPTATNPGFEEVHNIIKSFTFDHYMSPKKLKKIKTTFTYYMWWKYQIRTSKSDDK